MTVQVVKRDGRKEPLDIDKIHKVIQWACEDLQGVSVSEIELTSKLQFYNNITTKDIHETLIKAAANLITEDNPDYQYVAGRLINYQLRKEVYNRYQPIDLKSHYENVRELGYYDQNLSTMYSDNDWAQLNDAICHDRDFDIAYAGMEQFRGKYLVKNRVTKKYYETPQTAMMLIAMTLFNKYDPNERTKWVIDLYDAISTFDISMPTPIMAGVRTPQRQYSSCTLIDSGDSLDSITATGTAIVKYVSQRAGIGINGGRIRSLGSPVRNGDTSHTGVIPFYRFWQSAVKSCSQGAIRDGSATLHYPLWHMEVEDLLVLKNNKGTEESRIRDMDYSVQFNKVMFERLIEGGNITLFSPHDVPDLYEAFFTDTDKFRELYEKYERAYKIRKKSVPAIELFSSFMQERKDTGRIYFMNVDHCNEHGSFIPEKATIYTSNLCQEITLPTKPIEKIDDLNGEIALCVLGAINMGKIDDPKDFEKPCMLMVRALNALIDYQSYPVLAAELSTKNRRPLGIGIINYAYWLAKNGMTYSDTNLSVVHEYIEAWSYYLIKASVDMAKEQGCCWDSSDTKYHHGILPIDTYKKDVDDLVEPNYKQDWDSLRSDLIKYGILNSTVMALMPSESSSQVSNSTNAVEPPRGFVSVKQSKDGVLRQVVPNVKKYKKNYELLWDMKSPIGYLKNIAVIQKFVDQSISTNTSYNPENYPDDKIPMSALLNDLLWCYKYGIKTGYYFNTYDGAGEMNVQEDDCDSCKI
jgi:ribonucleoside-diphosphate reductase alpha chain